MTLIGRIFIKDLRTPVRIGVGEEERSTPQEILINISLWADIENAAKTEDIADTVNYSELQKKVVALASSRDYILLEALANEIADLCFEYKQTNKVFVRVEKPFKLKGSDSVGVEIEREA
jgi:FolB domain-containing protein